MDNNAELFSKFPLIVIDSGGGEILKQIAEIYIARKLSFWEARKIGYKEVKTDFTLNLDCDVVVPEGYVQDALKLLEYADAVSIFYQDVAHCQGALEFGVSMWKTNVLRKLYDFSMSQVSDGIVKVGSMAYATLNHGWCECTYMWRKLKNKGKLETLPYRAQHLK